MLLHRRIRLEAATGKNDAALRPNAPRRAVMSHDRADHALRAAQQPPGRAVRPDRNAACGQVVVQHLEQARAGAQRSEEHTSELQSLMRNSYAVFCFNKKTYTH